MNKHVQTENNEIQTNEYKIKIYFTLSETHFHAFFFEVKEIGEKFLAEEIRKTNSKIRWKIVANAASLKRYVASGRRSLSALFRIYEQDFPSIGRVIERVSKTREPGKWKHWHGGKWQ